ncbi:YbfB/YjiJ family MFS transporter [Pusillimonas sp. SM2304]|uniref:YbfB/YjiJ family MFS transporter n=1 Tax=Pusillimonas sp. SM2304 TaxID=3073241 RepID=UPI002873F62B|nr:YbfB/YjiJ family MFS transporter [Pusillimonas sp. SM2304]MDS1141231.1 YbfB/YjiJ family MFS transporter [Pusillimonas sp. SM2304]
MKPALISWALSGGAAVSVGFARFGYALILPAMQTDLGLNYAQAGWLNTANALGYLLGALLTLLCVSRWGNRRLFVAGLALTTAALLASGMTHHFHLITLFRFLAGFGAAGAFICGGVLSGVVGTHAIVIFFSGGGVGMLATGALLPWLFDAAGPAAWTWAWIACAAICAPLSWAAIAAMRGIAEPSTPGMRAPWPWRPCLPEFTAYFLFGLGYIAYMTFIVAWLRKALAPAISVAATTSIMWSLLGVMTLLAPLIWRPVFNGRRNGWPMAASMTVLAVGAALPLAFPTLAGLWLSAALVGSSVFMVPSAATAFVKTNLPRPAWGSALAVATSLFALGQTIGPVAAGWLSDLTGSLSMGLAASAAVLVIGALIAMTQKPLESQ